jgi:glycosyltransferase involved in cell wall biosynthesis
VKILLASSSSGSRGGGELFLLYLGEALVRRGHEITLWASSHPRMDELAAKFQRFGGKIARAEYLNTYDRRARTLSSFFDKETPKRVAAHWRELAPDCIHINKQNLEDGLDLLRAVEVAKTPAICTIHITQSATYLQANTAFLRDWIARHELQKTRIPLAVVLENRRRDLVEFLGSDERVHLVLNGVPLPDLPDRVACAKTVRAQLKFTQDAFLVIGVGRMVPQKRPLFFLELAEKLRATVPNARFAWIGDGPLSDAWDEWIRTRGLDEILSRVPWQDDVKPFLAAADLFLHTAQYEGLPLALLEAMAARLPCAVTENLLSEMPFLNPQNSISVGDDDRWLGRVKDRAGLSACGEAARKLIEAKFSCDEMAARYEALYKNACGL